MVFYKWNIQSKKWTESIYLNTSHAIHKIKCIAFNVLFNEKNGVAYRSNVVYSNDRYTDTLEKLFYSSADIITLNEVTKTFLKMVEECEWVRESYFISEITEIDDNNSSIFPFGNLILTKIPPSLCKIFKVLTLKRPIITGVFNVQNTEGKKIKFSLSSAHLISMANNYDQRKEQIMTISEEISKLDTDVNILQGDMNFHSETENAYVDSIGYNDVWTYLYDINKDPGYTFDSQKNLMNQEIWLGFENRRMRLDRVMISSKNVFDIVEMKIIFNEPIYKTCKIFEKIGLWKAFVSLLYDLFESNAYRQKEDYLFNSDHFGLETTFGF